jgi:NAD(P)-dependent dehydrogenase (short-subunit alcohol dehydrogenase family)
MSQRTALVTGAAAGIGAGIAERFSEDGYAIAAFDLDGEGARRMAERLRANRPAIAIRGDVALETQAQDAVERTVQELGSLDVLVNNAGIEVNGSVSDLSPAACDRQIAVNLRGAYLMSKYAIEKMRGRGGIIIHISSVHAFVSWEGWRRMMPRNPDCSVSRAQ